jgi:predicted enzyme related to lactoylglutathione lyase
MVLGQTMELFYIQPTGHVNIFAVSFFPYGYANFISEPIQNLSNMNSYVSIFEIPVTDLDRAIQFYHGLLDMPIEKVDIPDMKMGLFPFKEQQTIGVIIQEEGYIPSIEGITLYLNGGDDLQVILARAEENGGKSLYLRRYMRMKADSSHCLLIQRGID